MINDEILHQRENNSDTESFLHENSDKFTTDIMFLLKLMKKGERLSAKTVVKKYDIEPRRLRDLQIAGRCEKEWMFKENGKRSHVEYFVTTPHPPTKNEVIEKSAKIINLMKSVAEKTYVTVMDIGDDPPTPSPKQTSLF